MYTILFHVSGIAILELCFYFYYIGPMETDIFSHMVEQLVDEPIDLFNNENQMIPFNMTNLIPIEFHSELDDDYHSQTDLARYDNYMYEMRQNGIDRREDKNQQLFVKTIEYWFALFITSCIVFLIYKGVVRIHNNRKIHMDENETETEMTNMRSRKDSIDSEDLTADHRLLYKLEHQMSEPEIKSNISDKPTTYCDSDYENTYSYKLLHYSFYGGCILMFQYVFFQNVVHYYIPLTIEEVKYIVYTNLSPELKSNIALLGVFQ